MRTASMGVTALDLAVFISGSFVAALASQVAGFAYGLVAAAVWLQLLTPMRTVTLIIAFGPLYKESSDGICDQHQIGECCGRFSPAQQSACLLASQFWAGRIPR